MPYFLSLICFVFGTILGSFLNACIYRLPRDISLLKPKHSRCPNCKKQLKWQHLIPIVSYIVLRGKCASCKKKIPVRYLAVEILSGMLFALIPFLPTGHVLVVIAAWLLLGIFFTDLETHIIPDEFSYTGILIGLLYSLYIAGMNGLYNGAFGGLLAGAVFYIISFFGKLLYKKEALGGGDIKLVIMLGCMLWPMKTIVMLYLSFFIGSAIAVTLLMLKKKTRKDYIPFGPSIVLAGLIVLVWGDLLIRILFPYL